MKALRVAVVLVALILLALMTLLYFPEEAANPPREPRPPEDRTEGPRTTAAPPPPELAAAKPENALVPIAHLTSTRENVSPEELSRARNLAVPRDLKEAVYGLLGPSDLEEMESSGAVVDRVNRDPGVLGLVPWEEVGPRVKALSVDGKSLLRPGATSSEGYPLTPEGARVPDAGELRRVVVGGDVVLDRGQSYAVIQQGRGLAFPLDGGYAAVTGRTAEESRYSEFGVIHRFTAERRGESGAVREYLRGADLTLANLENPVVEGATWHPDATTFTGDPRLLPVLKGAGIDGVTLGNNHILDAGAPGISETIEHLRGAGISHTGAGVDLESAREPMIFDLGGTKIGVLNYQGVPSYGWSWATQAAPGTAPLREDVMVEDVRRLRLRVDLIVVMPHWGNEYIATPEPDQVEIAHAVMDAGADLVVGGHAHWPKGMEMYRGKPVFYGTGNFLFDQSWSEETSTGIFAEITLYGDRVVQARPIPLILLDYSQPNFLVPEAGGDRALETIYEASLGREFEAYGREGSAP